MRLPRALTGIAATVMLLVSVAFVQVATSGAAAAAPPGDCHWTGDNGGAIVVCNWPEYRAVIVCIHAGTDYTVDGPWVTSGHLASATCASGDFLKYASSKYSVSWELGDDW